MPGKFKSAYSVIRFRVDSGGLGLFPVPSEHWFLLYLILISTMTYIQFSYRLTSFMASLDPRGELSIEWPARVIVNTVCPTVGGTFPTPLISATC